jgi:septal ring factor EnvC (AmiA/AmiB activator)
MESLDAELVQSNKKIKKLEENIAMLQEVISQQQETMLETQRYLIKLAHGQQELSKRVLSWPYVRLQTKRTKDV